MDAANILSSSVPAQAAVNSPTTSASEVTIINAPVQQPNSTAAVSVPQGQVQNNSPQTDQDPAGPTFQLKIMIEQTIVQFLNQLDKLLDKPQTLADLLPEVIRQDLQQILSNQLLAATPETFEQGLTTMIKANKDTADSFSQLAKGLNAALTFQSQLPDSVQKFLQSARPLLTDLLVQTQSELTPQIVAPQPQTSGVVLNNSVLPQPSSLPSQAANDGQAQPQSQSTNSITTSSGTVAPMQSDTSVVVGSAPASALAAGEKENVALPNTAGAVSEEATVVQEEPAATVTAAQPGVVKDDIAGAKLLQPDLATAQVADASVQSNPVRSAAETVILPKEPAIAMQLGTVQTDDAAPTVPSQGLPASGSETISVSQQQPLLSIVKNPQMNDKAGVINSSANSNTKIANESTSNTTNAKVLPEPITQAQSVLNNILLLTNNPPVPTSPVGVDEFFNWIAQQFRQTQDNDSLQTSLQQKVDAWSDPLSQLSEQDSKVFNGIKQELEQQLPSQLKQIATKFPALKDLYIYNKMSDLAKYADLSQDNLSAAKDSISRLAETFQKSLVDSLSFHSETGSSGKVFTFFMPLAFDGTTMYPAHIHIYHQNQPEKRSGPPVAETWLRIFLKTDYSGTVTLLFHVRKQLVDMKLGFSDRQAARDFHAWLPDIRQSLVDSPFTLQDIQVLSA